MAQNPVDRITVTLRSFAGRGPALSEWAPSVGGGATTGRSQLAQSVPPGAEAAAAHLIRTVLQAAQDLDPRGLQVQLDVAATVLGLDRCVDEIVIPATREMRHRRATRHSETALDLIATEAIRAWLSGQGSFAPAPREVGPILLACGPRERHVVELESLALLLRVRRWPCRLLGARTSTFMLTIAAQAADAAAVVVMATETPGLPQAILSVLAIDALGVPAFLAGTAFETQPAQDQQPWRYLGSSVSGACALLTSTLIPPAQRRDAGNDRPEPQGR